MIPRVKLPSEENKHLKIVVKLLYARICYCEELMEINEKTMVRIAVDAAAMANNDIFKMGNGRVTKWENRVKEYVEAFDKDGREEANMRVYKGKAIVDGDEYVSATRNKIDTRLQQIYGDSFVSFDKRYNWDANDRVFKKYEKALKDFDDERKYIKDVLEGKR